MDKPDKRVREIREPASDRRVIARRLPMDSTLAGALAQNTLGCLGFLLIGTAGVVVVFYAHRGTWPWQPWVVALGGLVGQISGIGVIAWCRRTHQSAVAPDQ